MLEKRARKAGERVEQQQEPLLFVCACGGRGLVVVVGLKWAELLEAALLELLANEGLNERVELF